MCKAKKINKGRFGLECLCDVNITYGEDMIGHIIDIWKAATGIKQQLLVVIDNIQQYSEERPSFKCWWLFLNLIYSKFTSIWQRAK